MKQRFWGPFGCWVCGVRRVLAAVLSKPSRRVVEVELEYVGFEIPDEFVIGFGMDYAGRYRELEEVVVYEESRAAAAEV
jgi:hypoxanthine phosphoribosyltransferase